jgi:hypothetical protein
MIERGQPCWSSVFKFGKAVRFCCLCLWFHSFSRSEGERGKRWDGIFNEKGARECAMITKKVGGNQHELTVDVKIESKADAGGQDL